MAPPPPLDCDENTAALPATAIGEYGPVTRIDQMNVPANVQAAQAAGCELVGRNQGTGLASLLSTFMVDLNAQVQADAQGMVSTIVLAELKGWQPEQTGNDVRSVDLNFYAGQQSGQGEFLIDRSSFVNDDPQSPARVSLEASTTCETLETEQGDFNLSLAVGDVNLDLTLVQTRILGDLSVGPAGVAVDNGLLTGYLTDAGLVEVIRALQQACGSPQPPDFCEQAGAFLMGDPAGLVPVAALLMGGFDVAVAPGGGLDADCGFECNAISVCLQIETVPVNVAGVSD